MDILEPVIINLGLVIFSIGILFIHLRLRTKTSLALIVSYSTLAICLALGDWVFRKYVELTTESLSEAEWAALTPEQGVKDTAKAFSSMSEYYIFDTVSTIVLLVLFFTFCITFFLSAKSMPVSNYAIKGTSV